MNREPLRSGDRAGDRAQHHSPLTASGAIAAHGVAEYWIVDPEAEVIEQYLQDQAQPGAYRLAGRRADGELRSSVVDGFAVPVRAVFDDAENLRALRAILA